MRRQPDRVVGGVVDQRPAAVRRARDEDRSVKQPCEKERHIALRFYFTFSAMIIFCGSTFFHYGFWFSFENAFIHSVSPLFMAPLFTYVPLHSSNGMSAVVLTCTPPREAVECHMLIAVPTNSMITSTLHLAL